MPYVMPLEKEGQDERGRTKGWRSQAILTQHNKFWEGRSQPAWGYRKKTRAHGKIMLGL